LDRRQRSRPGRGRCGWADRSGNARAGFERVTRKLIKERSGRTKKGQGERPAGGSLRSILVWLRARLTIKGSVPSVDKQAEAGEKLEWSEAAWKAKDRRKAQGLASLAFSTFEPNKAPSSSISDREGGGSWMHRRRLLLSLSLDSSSVGCVPGISTGHSSSSSSSPGRHTRARARRANKLDRLGKLIMSSGRWSSSSLSHQLVRHQLGILVFF
jgi:hypothetical protein